MTKKKYRSFEQARKFARSQKFQNREEWKNFVKSGKLPDDIPRGPAGVYKNKGWKGWGNFLGTGNIAPQNRVYRSFKEARKFVHTLNLKTSKEWIRFTRSDKLPNDIPSAPNNTYKNKGWKGMGDWLGTGTIATYNIQYRPFKEAREFVRSLGLKNNREWKEYCKSGNKPDDIPANPNQTYKKDFKGVGDWLGTGTVATQDKTYRSFTEAREFARSLGLKNQEEWREYCRSGNKPEDIPASPAELYKKQWKGSSIRQLSWWTCCINYNSF